MSCETPWEGPGQVRFMRRRHEVLEHWGYMETYEATIRNREPLTPHRCIYVGPLHLSPSTSSPSLV